MRKLFFTLFIVVAGMQLNAQMHISTNLRQDYSWSESQDKWVLTSEDDQSSTLFDFNKDLTMFTHTTATITSTYYIKSSTKNTDNNTWEFDVVSDVGNKYHVILDPDNNNIRFIGTDSNGDTYLVRHTIKQIWTDN